MAESYKDRVAELNVNVGKVSKGSPEVMTAFAQLSKAATKDGVLDKKTKELVALAIAVAVRCDGCIGFHTKTLASLGTSMKEIHEVCAMSVYMGGGPSLMYASDAIKAFEEFSNDGD